ncbi:acyl-CoA desaturase [Cytophagaceae bacterium DM2B3-1]|uniref:Acyl-CoA desaturase n=1 Tax=Xanthocytophaga flava TaxID=3048013 RepID=A0AAE3QJT4_9BACT|nr:acyl-CoA desaturase [Xanthocytophaga flavus]MDJ1469703.1 acyl-CoA desaturase [Xanthocytophaga flavus]MDJ1480667.1 acyl-CoA desaturase [Xanthocytophaga flavus]MDJ1493645.1 acyl-CoA desaturase [Xanthocytophaga flavus]
MTAILIFFAIHWYGSLFFQTFFLHRYSAHGAFTMSRTWEKIFFVLTWIFQGSNYLSAYAYGVMHRMHHAFADTEDDPHSPLYSKGFFDMMWKTKTFYAAVRNRTADVDPKFMVNVPDWKAFDDFASNNFVRLMWGTLYTLFYIYFAPSWGWFLLLPVHFLMSPIHGAIINWFAHKIGYTTFTVSDTSRNLMPVDIFMMGEGFHNNHHTYGHRANFAFKWFEIDPTYQVIKLFNLLGIIKLPKKAAKESVYLENKKIRKAA